ncbi:MAG: sigma-54 dependent transcriptional regulator [Ignavibacteria bacterium]|nr:sigma-54 dependent transcriptional regulator [Ignavibacteria bacterium]
MTVERRKQGSDQGIIGSSLEMLEIINVIDQVAPTGITVLVTGESGVGKEVIAKAIHGASLRKSKPLVTVNSGAIPEGIIESELFGHEPGSFTGASGERKGYFELANGGTIFLDEIGELPLQSQVKFLRVLENGEFLRVGSSVTRKVDVRVIAATNKNLEAEVRHGRFRADLYFRLRSVNIHIPPLRQRTADIPVFFKNFAAEIAERNNIRFEGISGEAMDFLTSYHWPGNVRELRNAVESMLILGRGRYIEADDARRYINSQHSGEERNLPVPVPRNPEQAERELILRALLDIKGNLIDLKDIVTRQAGANGPVGQGSSHPDAVEQVYSLVEMERKMIADALQRFNNNRRLAARALRISERTLYRKIKEYGLP